MKLIDRDAALNFELQAEADPDEIQAITKGMALYAEHIKSLPVIEVPTPHGDLIDEVIRELGLNCCYEMPSFWTNNRKDYKVIATKYHKGYLQALEDVKKAVKQRVGWLESESEGE